MVTLAIMGANSAGCRIRGDGDTGNREGWVITGDGDASSHMCG